MSRGILSELPNGLKVATRAMPQVQSLSVGIWVKAGARDERDSETGIAHMLEHMAFKGTKRRSARDIATEVENVGGYMNAHTSREETAYYLRLLPEYLDMGIDILADILTEPTMPDEEIERERGVIIQEIGQSLDTPDDIVFDMFAKASYGSHTLGRPILGSVDSVSGFSRENLQGFMNRHYGAGQMLVTAAGAVDHDDFTRRVDTRLGSLATAEDARRAEPEWQGDRHVETRDLEQTHLVIGLPSFGIRDERRYALMLLSTLFGGGMSSRCSRKCARSAASAIRFSPLPACIPIVAISASMPGLLPRQRTRCLPSPRSSLPTLRPASVMTRSSVPRRSFAPRLSCPVNRFRVAATHSPARS